MEISTKKSIAFFTAVIMACGLAACGGNAPKIDIDYGNSNIYSKADMDAATELIKKEFATWDGHSISYSSDDCNSEENIEWMNALGGENTKFIQCIMFSRDFHSPKAGGGT